MVSTLVFFSVVVINTMTKNSLGGKGLQLLGCRPLITADAENQGMKHRSGTEAETMVDYCLLACSI